MSVSPRAPRARIAWLSLAALLILVVAGCTLKSGGYNTTSPPKIRFFNAGIDLTSVDVSIGGAPTVTLLGFEQFASYQTTKTGTLPLVVTQGGNTTVVTQTTQDFENGDRFSYVLYGRPDAPQFILMQDNVDLPGGGNTKLRFVNVATGHGALDMYVTDPGALLDNVAPEIANIPLGGVSDYEERGSGSVEIRFTPAGSKQVIYDTGQVTLSERNAYTLVAYNRGDPTLVNAGLFTMDTLGSGTTQNSVQGAMRVVNASAATPSVNLLVDNTPAVSNVAFPTATPYQLTPTGTHTVSFEASSTPGAALVSGTVLFPPGGDASVVLFGPAGSQQAFGLQDVNLLPMTAGNARVRVVNVRSDAGTVNTYVNGALTVGALSQASPSLYFELPAGSYLFSFTDAGTSAPLLDVPGVTLVADHTYTLFLIGPTGQLTTLLTTDR
jgi:hypothetical protein